MIIRTARHENHDERAVFQGLPVTKTMTSLISIGGCSKKPQFTMTNEMSILEQATEKPGLAANAIRGSKPQDIDATEVKTSLESVALKTSQNGIPLLVASLALYFLYLKFLIRVFFFLHFILDNIINIWVCNPDPTANAELCKISKQK